MLNIKEAMKKAGHDGILRSVNGIYDEVVYNGKEWKLIQRIQNDRIITCTEVRNHQEVGLTDCYFYPTKAPINGSTPNGLLSTHFVQGNTGVGTINLNNNFTYSGIFRYPNTGADLTKEEITAWLGENEVYVSYQLAVPQEYSLDLPQISTYEGQTYFATNAMNVKPRMVAKCQVSEKLDYIKDGLLGCWTGRERSNTETNRDILPDLSGNGNDLTNYNMAYTIESGYGDGYIQYDGIDDYSNVEWTDITAKSVLLVCEDIVNTKESPYYSQTSMVGNDRSLFGNISNGKIKSVNIYGYYNGTDLGTEIYSKDFTVETGILNIYLGSINGLIDNPTYIYNACLGAGNYYNNPPRYSCKLKAYDFLIYDRKLTDEEIAYNYKVSRQLNGEDFSFDPVEQSLVASYRAYDKTNEDEDRDVLTDLSGNGHDIQLYNFAFSEDSGYNKSTYQGALVSDGVDDYGLCENFPTMYVERGYTVCAIRKWINIDLSVNTKFITEQSKKYYGNFGIEAIISGIKHAISFNSLPSIDFDENLNFIYQRSNNYNGTNISNGSNPSFDGNLGLFKDLASAGNYKCSKIALYALEIYNRDLTDEEIAKVKARMIAEYEEKTGNKYEEENYLTLNTSKLDIAKLK
ncbi:hypothetical protein [uncultured phage cr118_1]|uniref:Uncharacterized protein n=1 Tax=uncultured phage cr118_1 TaxID=2772063 RepID=A0A7M1RZB2_9CAUD|nr:hypothetical protein KNV30_gp01 [uncultured phage cr118_1]QOR58360.1 hypothetical protein [uncultured phage cr118_1]